MASRSSYQFEYVRILWGDAACASLGWRNIEEVPDAIPVPIFSCGYLVRETDDVYVICMAMDFAKETFSNHFIIPKGMVLHIERDLYQVPQKYRHYIDEAYQQFKGKETP